MDHETVLYLNAGLSQPWSATSPAYLGPALWPDRSSPTDRVQVTTCDNSPTVCWHNCRPCSGSLSQHQPCWPKSWRQFHSCRDQTKSLPTWAHQHFKPQWTRQRYALSPLLFDIVLEVLVRVIRQEKERNGIQIRKKEAKLSLFADDRIFYIGNPTDYAKNLSSMHYDELSEKELKKTIAYTKTSKIIKCLGIHLTKKQKVCTLKTVWHWWMKLKKT